MKTITILKYYYVIDFLIGRGKNYLLRLKRAPNIGTGFVWVV